MMKNGAKRTALATLIVLFLSACSVVSVHPGSERASIEDFNYKVSQLHVGAEIEIITENTGKVGIKIAKIGTDYIDGYVSGANIQEDEWWTTRYYFKSLKSVDSYIVPTDVLPDPVIQADREEIAEDDNSVSINDFNHKVSQLQVGAEIEIITVIAGKIELEIANIGTDYIEGYVSGANLQEDEWWTTRYYYTDIKAIYVPVVPIVTLPEPVVQADKTEISENVDSYLAVEEFNQKIAQLQVGSKVDVLALGEGRIEVEITEVGNDYIEGYVSNPVMATDEWWTTRYYFKNIKVIDAFVVPIEYLPEPVVRVEKKSKKQASEHVPSKGSQGDNETPVIVKAIGYVVLFALYFAVIFILAGGVVIAGLAGG